MSKKQELELLLKADLERQEVEKKKLDRALIEAKERREHFWIWIIWSAGAVVIIAELLYLRNFWRF